MAGIYPGFPNPVPPLTGNERAAFDTQLPNGMPGQTIQLTTSQLAAAAFTGAPAGAAPLTAAAGGGRPNAVPLVTGMNVVATVGTAADSVVLPAALRGAIVYLRNQGANSLQVFGAGTDTINGTAGATGVAQATVTGAVYFCNANGTWFRVQGAAG